MKELSLRQDPDLRKELALLARGCDFVLPSRFKKRLQAFHQGQAGVSARRRFWGGHAVVCVYWLMGTGQVAWTLRGYSVVAHSFANLVSDIVSS